MELQRHDCSWVQELKPWGQTLSPAACFQPCSSKSDQGVLLSPFCCPKGSCSGGMRLGGALLWLTIHRSSWNGVLLSRRCCLLPVHGHALPRFGSSQESEVSSKIGTRVHTELKVLQAGFKRMGVDKVSWVGVASLCSWGPNGWHVLSNVRDRVCLLACKSHQFWLTPQLMPCLLEQRLDLQFLMLVSSLLTPLYLYSVDQY